MKRLIILLVLVALVGWGHGAWFEADYIAGEWASPQLKQNAITNEMVTFSFSDNILANSFSYNISLRSDYAGTLRWGDASLSNLTVSVEVVTNTSSATQREVLRVNPIPCPDYDGGNTMCAAFHCEPEYGDVTQSNVTTQVCEIRTLTFCWDGIKETLVRKKVLREDVKKYRKREEWEEVK